jgi:hypothetical protein
VNALVDSLALLTDAHSGLEFGLGVRPSPRDGRSSRRPVIP